MINCIRCHGDMIEEDVVSMNDSMSFHRMIIWKCVQCGERIDNVIIKNRILQLKGLQHKRESQRRPYGRSIGGIYGR